MLKFLRSTILSKIVMAITGAAIVGFLIAHLAGNMLVFAGPEKINAYGQGLKDLGPLLWVMRSGLIVFLLLHVVSSIILADKNRTARPINYEQKKSLQSTFASRSMFYSGLSILTFVTYHLMHYTFGLVQPEFYHGEYMLQDGRMVHDIYRMLIYGFTNPFITVSYAIAILFICLHLSHAIPSAFQTLGINHPKYNSIIKKVSTGLAALIFVGYLSIPAAVMAGALKLIEGAK